MAIVRRNDPVRLFFRRLGMVALLILILLVATEAWDVYSKQQESSVLRVQAENQLVDLEAQRMHLEAEITDLRTLRGKEETLRENYELGRTGEGLIIIVDPPIVAPVHATSTFREWVHKFLPFW